MGPYRRLVAVVYRDNRSINRWLLRRGHAWEYDRHSDDWMPRWLEWLACVGDESEPVGWR